MIPKMPTALVGIPKNNRAPLGIVDVGVSACLRCHPYRCNRNQQPAAAITKYSVHIQVEASLLTVIPLTTDTRRVMPKKVPPTSNSTLALCQLAARTPDQQP